METHNRKKLVLLETPKVVPQGLGGDAEALLSLIVFFAPDTWLELSLLTNHQAGLTDNRLAFLFETARFKTAVCVLCEHSLAQCDPDLECLATNSTAQNAASAQLSSNDESFFSDAAVTLLSHGFPNAWLGTGPQQGHGYEGWNACAEISVHVGHIKSLFDEQDVLPLDLTNFSELVFRMAVYWWETEAPSLALTEVEYGLSLQPHRRNIMCAQALRVLGNTLLDLARPRAALEAYQEALAIRLTLIDATPSSIADVLDAIACSQMELGNVDDALTHLSRATEIHIKEKTNMARTQFIYALNYLRGSWPDDALASLNHCWESQGMTQEQIAASRYPKHSGDLVLLSRILNGQGSRDNALELASKTITIRKNVLGDRGPRVADSMFTVATFLREEQKDALAARLLREIMQMSEGMREMQGQLARALWTLGRMEEANCNNQEAMELQTRAKEVRDGIDNREAPDEETDDAFQRLVPWFVA